MQNTHTFGIDIIHRLLPRDKSIARLYARITVNGKPSEISLKQELIASDWDSSKERVIGKGIEVQTVNEFINGVRFRIIQHYRDLKERQPIVTALDVKNAYLGIQTSQNEDHTFCELIKYHEEQMTGKLKPGTLKNYKATEEYVKRFIKRKFKLDDIYLVQLNYAFITEFETYIPKNPIKKHDKCTSNGTAKHIERVIKMVKWAKKLKWVKVNPFEDFSPHKVKVYRPKLKMLDLMKLEESPLMDEKLNFVKDIFEFACYTGLAYVDLMAIRPEDFVMDSKGKTWCTYHRQKSSSAASIPLLARALYLLDKYKDDPRSIKRGTVFPYLSNQEVNRSLKIIQEIYKIPLNMTFHLARHTFATTMMLKSGVPMETVSKMLGHVKLSTTQIYAEVDEEKIEQDMASVEQKLIDRKNLLKAV